MSVKFTASPSLNICEIYGIPTLYMYTIRN